MYSNNIVKFQESTTILNAMQKVWKLIEGTTYIYIYINSCLVPLRRTVEYAGCFYAEE